MWLAKPPVGSGSWLYKAIPSEHYTIATNSNQPSQMNSQMSQWSMAGMSGHLAAGRLAQDRHQCWSQRMRECVCVQAGREFRSSRASPHQLVANKEGGGGTTRGQ